MPSFDITWIDITILIGYVLGTRVFFAWYVARKTRLNNSEGYFLGGRNIGWPILGLSFYVSNMSGSTFVGLPASGYATGIAVFNYEWLPAFILIFFIIFLLPLYLRGRVYTAPEYLSLRYGTGPRLWFSGFLLLANIFIDSAAALYAGGVVFQVLFPEIPLWMTVAVTAALAGLYIFFGGLGAVVINDALQAAMIFIGGALIAILAWQQIPSWSALAAQTPDYTLSLMRPADDEVLPWPGVFTGVLIIGIYFWCTNQFMIQRALGARSLREGRYGALFAGALKLPNLFILILPGVMAASLYPRLDNPDLVFPTMVFDLFPVGLRGLMLAALAAAILSSLESILNSASTLFTMDFVRSLRPQTPDTALVWTGRIATLVFMLLAALWAPQIQHFPSLWQYLQSILSYVTPPIVVLFLFGIFWQRANYRGAWVTMAVGFPLGVAGWLAVEIFGLFELQFLYACGILFAVNTAVMILASLSAPPPGPAIRQKHVWTPALWHADSQELADVPWYRNFRVHSLMLAALTAALVLWWL